MTADRALDIVRGLFGAAQHPDIRNAARYENRSQQGVAVLYRSGAKAFLWLAEGRTKPADFPEEFPEYKHRAMYALKLLVDLLDAVRPVGVEAWRTVEVEGTALSPCGVEIRAGGETVLLRVTSASPPVEETAHPSQWAGWEIPAGISVD